MSIRSRSISASAVLAFAVLLAGGESGPSFAQAQPGVAAGRPEVRRHVDADRGRVWWLSEAGLFVQETGRTARTELALPGWDVAREPYSCLPDLALGPRGDALVTSNVTSTLWRIDARTLAVTVHRLALDSDRDKDVGFTGLVYSPAQAAFFAVSGPHGTLWRIDPQLTSARKVEQSALLRGACGLASGPISDRLKEAQ